MRIALDVAALGSGIGGDETWVRGLLDGLAHGATPHESFPLLVPHGATVPDSVRDHPSFPVLLTLPNRRGLFHFAVDLPRALEGERADMVLSVTHAPIRCDVPAAMVVGDLSFVHHPELFPRSVRVRLNSLVPRQARKARLVIVPSEFSRGDAIDAFGLDPERVVVVPNRVESPVELTDSERASAQAWATTAGVHTPFVLYLGNLHPRKNLRRLIEAFGRMSRASGLEDVRLVVAGGRWWDADEVVQAAALAPADTVIQVGQVDETKRRWLLSEATALAYPSLFEGFGLPPVEAMSYGTPVVASDRSAMPEVLGDAAVLVDPFDVSAISGALEAVLTDGALRARLSAAGPARAAEYTSERVGVAALAAFRNAVDPSSVGPSIERSTV